VVVSVAVVASAWRTPLGSAEDEVLDRLLAGERGARPNARFDAGSYACSIASTIAGEPPKSRHLRYLRRMGLFAADAAREALAKSGIAGSERLGLFAGVGGLRAHWNELMPALVAQEPDLRASWARGLGQLHPFWMLSHLSNNAHALLSIELGAKGDGVTCGGANGGAQALASAIASLESGAIDAALVVAYDTLVEPETLVEQASRGALATVPLESLRSPYDAGANGRVPGEAAAAVVLVRASEAPAGAARIDVRDAADGSTGEASAELVGSVARSLVSGIGVVDGASLSRAAGDASEREILGKLARSGLPLVSTASAFGALGAATAVVQVIALAGLLRRGMLPPIAGLRDVADGPLVPLAKATPTSEKVALGLAAGAPGLASAVRVEIP
jgi:3-oxoacyl-[acyl-carrier-protein] synthase II